MNPHWITLLGGLEIIGGAAMTRWPETPDGLIYFLFVAGVITVIYGARGIWLTRTAASKIRHKNWMRMWHLQRGDRWPFRRILPMQQAAAIAHEKTDETLYASTAERFATDDPRTIFALALWNDGANQLYGTKRRSRMLREIPNDEHGQLGFYEGGKVLKRHGDDQIYFDNVHIKRADMKRRIKEMKA